MDIATNIFVGEDAGFWMCEIVLEHVMWVIKQSWRQFPILVSAWIKNTPGALHVRTTRIAIDCESMT